MLETIQTCHDFAELVEELRSARQRGLKLLSASQNPQLGEAVGFKLQGGLTLRLRLSKISEFMEREAAKHPDLLQLAAMLGTVEGRIRLFHTC